MLKNVRILVVDDAPTIRHVLRALLEDAGYQVATVGSAAEALAALDDQSYALVIVDKNLEDQDGFAVCRAARTLAPNTARIVITSDQSVDSAIRAVDEGIFAYMTKPLSKSEVLLKVRRAIESIHLAREHAAALGESERAKEALQRRSIELESTLERLLKTQTQLVENEKLAAVGMLAAGVAHEINNPACFILPNLEYLKRSAASLGELALAAGAPHSGVNREVEHINRMLNRCLEGLERIRRVVETLQLFSRRESQDVGPVDLHSLAISLIDLVTRELLGRAALEVDLEPVPPIKGRQKEVAQAVLNLLLNARRSVLASPEPHNHLIRVRSVREGNEVALTITDTGPPLRTEPLANDQTGEAFLLESVTDPLSTAPWISLRLVREILDRYGGRLDIGSTGTSNRITARFPLVN